ncbi:MAG: 3-oxoacyl-[acyl-carrier-protein] reductase [Gemmatimonadota bacterium]|nr:3-oxoacyl-[acyl-carrier-protein] reductase [Gemmatimonadota bacterium]
MTESGELSGTVAVVTGGSRGIGLAVSAELARAGARVAVIALDSERAAAAANSLEGDGHVAHSCDVADSGACRTTVREVEKSVGPISILVNNAGVTRDNILVRMRDEEWAQVVSTNLGGAFNMVRAVARGMMKRRTGSIINISSVIGLMGNAGQANYAASKAGLHGLTRSVARELASRNVRCNAVAPGFIRTDMTAALGEEAATELKQRIPLGRLGEPDDVAGVVRFLAGPEARYITGQVIAVDGGMAM